MTVSYTHLDVIEVAEDVLKNVWALIGYDLSTPIPRMTYKDAMERYGSDKPDLRFGLELTDLTEYFKDTTFRVFQAPYVGAVVMPGGGSQPRRTFDKWQEWAKARGAKGLAYVCLLYTSPGSRHRPHREGRPGPVERAHAGPRRGRRNAADGLCRGCRDDRLERPG